jgi:hypothetical protein
VPTRPNPTSCAVRQGRQGTDRPDRSGGGGRAPHLPHHGSPGARRAGCAGTTRRRRGLPEREGQPPHASGLLGHRARCGAPGRPRRPGASPRAASLVRNAPRRPRADIRRTGGAGPPACPRPRSGVCPADRLRAVYDWHILGHGPRAAGEPRSPGRVGVGPAARWTDGRTDTSVLRVQLEDERSACAPAP